MLKENKYISRSSKNISEKMKATIKTLDSKNRKLDTRRHGTSGSASDFSDRSKMIPGQIMKI